MKNQIIVGIAVLIQGILLSTGTQTIFPVCGIRNNAKNGPQNMSMNGKNSHTENGDMQMSSGAKMKCYWTGRAEIGVGALIAVIGLFLLIFRKKQARLGLSLTLAPAGLLAILIPDVLIGVCEGANMTCRTLALPAINIIGAAVIVIACVNIFRLLKTGKEE